MYGQHAYTKPMFISDSDVLFIRSQYTMQFSAVHNLKQASVDLIMFRAKKWWLLAHCRYWCITSDLLFVVASSDVYFKWGYWLQCQSNHLQHLTSAQQERTVKILLCLKMLFWWAFCLRSQSHPSLVNKKTQCNVSRLLAVYHVLAFSLLP